MKIRNNTGQRYSIAGHECGDGETVTLDGSAVPPSVHKLIAIGALSEVKEPKSEKPEKATK